MERDKVLVIDDTATILELVELGLREDYQVFTASNGLDGVKLFKQHQFRLVLIDIQMPQMDGFKTLEVIQSYNTAEPASQLVFLSGKNDPDTIVKCGDSEADDFISKVLTGPELILQIRELLDEEDSIDTGAWVD